MAETRTMLAELPDPNKLLAFDRNRHVMVTMAENIERATRPQLQELVQLLVERAHASGPAALLWRPRTDPNALCQPS
jgi:hypothetical protein